MTSLIPLFVLAAALAWIGTLLARRFAIAAQVLDVPNARSSHTVPTPRGGGLAIVLVVLAGLGAGVATGSLSAELALTLAPGAASLALVGWLDDRGGVSVPARLVIQIGAAAWAVYRVGPVPVAGASLGPLDAALSVLFVVWVTNLFNFMDGIDGIAAGQALTVAGLLALAFAGGASAPLAWSSALIAGAALGFLVWNWTPARIFMGDVGSLFLGYLLACLGLLGARDGTLRFSGWMVLMALFLLDATVTLVRRMVRKERWSEAHKSHAYQRAVQAGRSPGTVTAVVMLVNVGLGILVLAALDRPDLWPAAWMAGAGLPLLLYAAVERARPM